jgi:hypothetical protein
MRGLRVPGTQLGHPHQRLGAVGAGLHTGQEAALLDEGFGLRGVA